MFSLKRLGVGRKQGVLVAIAVVSTLSVGVIGWRGLTRLEDTSVRMLAAGEVTNHHLEADMMHDALRGDVLAALLADDDAKRNTVRAELLEHGTKLRSMFAENARLLGGSKAGRTVAGTAATVERYLTEADRVVTLALADPAAGRAAIPEFMRMFSELEDEMATVTELLDSNARAIQVAGTAGVLRQLGLVIVVAVTLLLTLGFVITRSITVPLRRAVQVLNAVADRDLDQRLEVDSQDEIGQMATALNDAVQHVRAALQEVRAVSDQLAGASVECADAARAISDTAQDQASSLEETAASIEEITATVKQSADNASQASQLASSSRDTAEKGGAVVGEAVNAMTEINRASKRIADIILTIDEIAFQTNLLALNAAVEAARAGEQGRGFAVVATEVRNLAQRSAVAAREIKGLIQDSVGKVDGGTALVNRSGQTLDEIVLSVRRVTDIVGEMAAAAREQSAGIEQVNRAVALMDRATQSNAARTEEMSATAGTLQHQADQLRSLVGRFRLDQSQPAAPRRAPLAADATVPVESNGTRQRRRGRVAETASPAHSV